MRFTELTSPRAAHGRGPFDQVQDEGEGGPFALAHPSTHPLTFHPRYIRESIIARGAEDVTLRLGRG